MSSLLSLLVTLAAQAQNTEPVVARAAMTFRIEDKVVDEIEKGDLLTVLEAKEDSYLVMTFNGKKGWVQKVNAVMLAEAVEIYDELLKDEKADPRLYTLRASAWWARGQQEKALADYNSAIEKGYNKPHAFMSRGLFHASLGKADAALADYNKALELSGEDDAAYINRAAVYMTQQKFDLAIKDYDSAIKIKGDRPSTYQQRAVAHKLAGAPEAAIADFGKAIELDDRFVAGYMGRGFLYYQQGQNAKAIEDFSAVIKLQPKAVLAYNNRGYNRLLTADYAGALADFDEAIRLAPEYALAYQNKAWLLATCEDDKLRDGKAAVAAATKACELREFKVVADLKALAAAYAEAGEWETAIGWQEKVVEKADTGAKPTESEILQAYQNREPFRQIKLAEEAETAALPKEADSGKAAAAAANPKP